MDFDLVPGAYVVNSNHPDWGLGQVQSALANKVTVNFENMGKVVVNTDNAPLTVVDPDDYAETADAVPEHQ